MKAEGVSFRHSVELLQSDQFPSFTALAHLAPAVLARSCASDADSNVVKKSTVRKFPIALEHNVEDTLLMQQVVDYYHQTLKQSPDALDYLEKRDLANSKAIDHFKIGFANRSLDYRLPAKNRKEGAAIRGQLQRIGLYQASGNEHFNGSL
jgi:DNA primase